MNCRVLYFSVSGNSKRIAQKIAEKTGCGISQITDNKSWKGPFGFIRGGFYAGTFRTTQPLVTPEVDFNAIDRILIVGPVWAGNAAPAVYSLLEMEKSNLHKICLVLSSGGGDTESVFKRVESKVGSIPFKFGIPKSKVDENEMVARAADVLK